MEKRLHVYKYQGAGNDFVLIDNREYCFSDLDFLQIARLCDRRFGIGADGLMLLEKHREYPFCMRFFNSDGMPGSMCGNGGRCISAFALRLGMVKEGEPFVFWSSDGAHQATVLSAHGNQCMVRLKMRDVHCFARDERENAFLLDTGSPHYVRFCRDVQKEDVFKEGGRIRFSDEFPEGTNVDFVEKEGNVLNVRTYERGVEGETFSCGTGAVASAMACAINERFPLGNHSLDISAKGGQLQVDFRLSESGADTSTPSHMSVPPRFSLFANRSFTEVFLEGLATFVFEAYIDPGL